MNAGYMNSFAGFGKENTNQGIFPTLPTTPEVPGLVGNTNFDFNQPTDYGFGEGYGSMGDWSKTLSPEGGGSNMFGDMTLKGAGTALSGISDIGQMILGLKQYNQAKKQAGFQRGMATTNLANQAKTTNAQLADRQAFRVAGDTKGRYASVDDYMAQYGVSGTVG